MKTDKRKPHPLLENVALDGVVQKPKLPRGWVIKGPERTLTFLRAVATAPPIRVALEAYGYTRATHDEGWHLLELSCGYYAGPPVTRTDERARGAILAIDARDEDVFRITTATLTRHFPEQAAFVLDGIGADTGIASVLAMAHLLDRLDALESSPTREATRTADHAALALLGVRTLTPSRRAELRGLVTLAQTATTPDAPAPAPIIDLSQGAPDRETALHDLRAWFDEWSEIAKTCIKRRDHLISLGLATRRTIAKQ